MAVVSYVSWRTGRAGFTLWHLTRDAAFTLCGRRPEGRITVWEQRKPPTHEVCTTCSDRWTRESEIR
jgi:hypothetical protein